MRWIVISLLLLVPATLSAAAQALNAVDYCLTPGALDQSCINAAGAAAVTAAHAVYIPAGLYVISLPVTFYSGVTYSGAGQGLTVLQEAAGVNLPHPFATPPSASHVTIQDLTLDGNAAQNTGGGQMALLDMDGVSGSNLLRTTVQNFYGLLGGSGPCVLFGNITHDNLIQDNHILNCGGPGRLSDAIYVGGTRNRVLGNLIDHAGDTGVVAEGGVDEVISNNVIHNTPQPIAVDGLLAASQAVQVAISGNTIDGALAANGAAIFIINAFGSQTSRIAITGNVISNLTDGHGILVEGSSEVTVSGNVLSQISPSAQIFKSGIVAIESSNLTVTGNSVRGASGSGLDLQGDSRVVVGSNLLSGNGLVHGFGIVTEDAAPHPGTSIQHSNGVCFVNLASASFIQPGDVVTVTGTGDPVCLGQHTVSAVNSNGTQVGYVEPGSGPTGGTCTLTRNSSHVTITGNESGGGNQQIGLWITGGSTSIFVNGNQLSGNQDAALSNTSVGEVQVGVNQVDGGTDATTGGLQIASGGLSLASGVSLQSTTSSGRPVNLMMLTTDTPSITRFLAGDDAGGFQWTDQGQSHAWMSLDAAGLRVGGGAPIANSSAVVRYVGSVVAGSRYQDSLAVTGLTPSAHCLSEPANAQAANLVGVWVAPEVGAVSLSHPYAPGAQFNLFCSF